MNVMPREPIEVFAYRYPSSTQGMAAYFDGMVDQVTGDLYLSTVDGVRKVATNTYIVRVDGGIRVMTEQEVFERFVPVDTNEAYRMLGGRTWPTSEQLEVLQAMQTPEGARL